MNQEKGQYFRWILIDFITAFEKVLRFKKPIKNPAWAGLVTPV
jgi:hypothetical protein